MAATRCLSINGNDIGGVGAQILHPGQEAGLEHLWVDRGDDVAQRVMAGDAMLIELEAAQEAQALVAPEVDLDEVIRTGYRGTKQHQQDLWQRIQDFCRLTRVTQRGEVRQKGCLCWLGHRGLLIRGSLRIVFHPAPESPTRSSDCPGGTRCPG
jgi:hypothetical protein